MDAISKIIIVVPTSKLGGAEKLLKNIALHLSDKDVQVHIIKRTCSSWEHLEKKISIKYYSKKNLFIGIFKFIFTIKLSPKTYIFSSHVITNSLMGIIKRNNRSKVAKLICRESTDVYKRFTGLKLLYYKFLYFISYSAIDLLVFQTTTMEASFKSNIFNKLKNLDTKIIPNPIILNNKNVRNIPSWQSTNYIVSAGRLIKEKGFDILIKGFSDFYQENKDYKLVILGEGHLRKNLQDSINRHQLENVVTLKGQVSNPLDYFKSAKICIVSSILEGFPNVLLEMMSQNTKVISTLCAGDIDKIIGIEKIPINNENAITTSLNNISVKNTEQNRKIFDKQLNDRSMYSYMLAIIN